MYVNAYPEKQDFSLQHPTQAYQGRPLQNIVTFECSTLLSLRLLKVAMIGIGVADHCIKPCQVASGQWQKECSTEQASESSFPVGWYRSKHRVLGLGVRGYTYSSPNTPLCSTSVEGGGTSFSRYSRNLDKIAFITCIHFANVNALSSS
jgi:hypothetical protein